MVLDSSALNAVLLGEPERPQFLNLVAAAGVKLLSAANALETTIVIESRLGAAGGHALDAFLQATRITIVAVDIDQLAQARQAWRNFGKGRHRAGLNFGDCFAYALAKVSGEPLLAKGSDFQRTDLQLL